MCEGDSVEVRWERKRVSEAETDEGESRKKGEQGPRRTDPGSVHHERRAQANI